MPRTPYASIMRTAALAAIAALLPILLASCGGISPNPTRTPVPNAPGRDFTMKLPEHPQIYATKEVIEKEMPADEHYEYRLGPGDIVGLQVWRRPELTQPRLVVSPDGFIAIPRIGMLNVNGKTPKEATDEIITKLKVLYTIPEVTFQVHEFQNNKAYVLGNVHKPGLVHFSGVGTLLEALSHAGGIPHTRNERMTRCSIIRGKDQVIWIDLRDLLDKGNMALNAQLRNKDIVYVPNEAEELVYVMGEVKAPGAISMSSGMHVLKAVMLAGGMLRSANPEKVFIIRQQEIKGNVVEVNLQNLIENADFSQNYILQSNDIIFVSASGIGKFNYAIDNITPSLSILSLGISNAESLGIMQEVRKSLWGQEGFVSPSE